MERYRQVWNKNGTSRNNKEKSIGSPVGKNRVEMNIETLGLRGASERTLATERFSFFGTRVEQGKIKRA